MYAVLFGAVGEVSVEVGEIAEEGVEIGLLQSPAGGITITISLFLGEFLDELRVEGAAYLLVRDAEGEDVVLEILDGEIAALIEHGDRTDVFQLADIQILFRDIFDMLVVLLGKLIVLEVIEDESDASMRRGFAQLHRDCRP